MGISPVEGAAVRLGSIRVPRATMRLAVAASALAAIDRIVQILTAISDDYGTWSVLSALLMAAGFVMVSVGIFQVGNGATSSGELSAADRRNTQRLVGGGLALQVLSNLIQLIDDINLADVALSNLGLAAFYGLLAYGSWNFIQHDLYRDAESLWFSPESFSSRTRTCLTSIWGALVFHYLFYFAFESRFKSDMERIGVTSTPGNPVPASILSLIATIGILVSVILILSAARQGRPLVQITRFAVGAAAATVILTVAAMLVHFEGSIDLQSLAFVATLGCVSTIFIRVAIAANRRAPLSG